VRHAPKRSSANSSEDVAYLLSAYGIELDEWQEVVLEAAMHERADGRWSTPQVGVSTPRQNGKSQLIVARALAGALVFNEKTIIISAHQQDTAREVFTRITDLIDRNPMLADRVSQVMNALNREFVKFKNGATIRFKARSKGGGRGFSCDCLLLDEAQILGAVAWSAILPTMSARPNPQVWLLGTPPTAEDDGEVFSRIRETALAGNQHRLAYLEWSATVADDFDSPETWAKANPSFGSRITEDAILGERSSMTDAQFAMERLGIWSSETALAVIPSEAWAARAIPAAEVPTDEPAAYGLDMSHDRVVSIGVCVGEHVEVAALDKVSDTLGAVEWLIERAGKKIPVVVDGQSPAASMVSALRNAGVRVVVTSAADMAKACGAFYDAVIEERLTHFDQAPLNAALSGARKRPIGTAGGWGWDRKDYSINLAPLVSVTLARFGATAAPAAKKPSAAFAF
jgi:hypothetical protein